MSVQGGHASLIGATFGPYEVQALIGRGAMGTVYLARDVTLKRYVALKVLLGHLARNPLLVRRFHREAQATAHLRHPNIVRIYAAGVEAGTPYIAMEFVEGEPLDRFLRRQGRLDWQRALHIGSQVAEALSAAHAEGIVHRDVKPANIMLDRQGRVRLTDFGIAHVHADLDEGPPEESFLGTPRYMSPEQCAAREIGPPTDLFSLGIVLYEMIAGELPFQAETAVALIKSITNDEPPRLNKRIPAVPDDVARLVAHLLEKKAVERPASASEVVRRIALLHAESGGYSALPEALTAFIREQAEPRALPSSALALPRGERDKTPSEHPTPVPKRRWGRPLVACAVVVAAAVLPPAWMWIQPANASARAATEVTMVVAREEAGRLVFEIPNTRLVPRQVAWLSDDRQIAVWLQGRKHSMLEGAEGILGIDTETRQTFSIVAPARDPAGAAVSFDLVRPGLFFVDMILAVRAGSERVEAYAWQQSVPAATWTLEPGGRDTLPWARHESRIAWHPDGDWIARVERGVSDGMDALVEYELPEEGGPAAPMMVEELSHPAPDSVHYSPNGQMILYTDGPRADEQYLHVSDRTSGMTPRRLCQVAPDAEASFSPDGSRIISTGSDGRLQLTKTALGTTESLAPGVVSRHAWHPSGAYVVFTASGSNQVWAMETSRPYRTQLVADVAGGEIGLPAISADGTRVAIWTVDDRGVRIVIVPMISLFGTSNVVL